MPAQSRPMPMSWSWLLWRRVGLPSASTRLWRVLAVVGFECGELPAQPLGLGFCGANPSHLVAHCRVLPR
jgi:hypothetical protein